MTKGYSRHCYIGYMGRCHKRDRHNHSKYVAVRVAAGSNGLILQEMSVISGKEYIQDLRGGYKLIYHEDREGLRRFDIKWITFLAMK